MQTKNGLFISYFAVIVQKWSCGACRTPQSRRGLLRPEGSNNTVSYGQSAMVIRVRLGERHARCPLVASLVLGTKPTQLKAAKNGRTWRWVRRSLDDEQPRNMNFPQTGKPRCKMAEVWRLNGRHDHQRLAPGQTHANFRRYRALKSCQRRYF